MSLLLIAFNNLKTSQSIAHDSSLHQPQVTDSWTHCRQEPTASHAARGCIGRGCGHNCKRSEVRPFHTCVMMMMMMVVMVMLLLLLNSIKGL
jgi:hypothetical protein